MKNNNVFFEELINTLKKLGANNAQVINTSDIVLERAFRDMCAVNSCGMYGKCWTCPPDVGNIDALMSEVGTYDYALVYQKIGTLEDSFDFEGMIAAKRDFYELTIKAKSSVDAQKFSKLLHLGAGGCGVCKVCAKRTNEPCRFPELALASLEAYGVNVSKLAASAGMKYINGVNTVTYFGAILFSL